MELKINVSKVLILDTPFEPKMLENKQAVIAIVERKPVMMVNVDFDDINEQITSHR